MNAACSFLVGEHDFRNFCYIDRAENRLGMTYVRGIKEAHVEELRWFKCESSIKFFKIKFAAIKRLSINLIC
jgi:tRNA U38,U39,U40 pseudouridine synthase TruA